MAALAVRQFVKTQVQRTNDLTKWITPMYKVCTKSSADWDDLDFLLLRVFCNLRTICCARQHIKYHDRLSTSNAVFDDFAKFATLYFA